jgi:sialate O-acetylesterase
MKKQVLSLAVLGLVFSGTAWADVRLPKVFGDHMVLQQEKEIPVWGWADPGEKVEVSLTGGAAVAAVADAKGQWQVKLPAVKAGGGALTLTVAGNNRIEVKDVLAGEVWVCSGQSNMEMRPNDYGPGILNKQQEQAAATYPEMRFFSIPKTPSMTPCPDTNAVWQVMSPATFNECSSTSYFFGRELHKVRKVPVGLLVTAWGGTRIEPWTPLEGFAAVPACKPIAERLVSADPASPVHKEKLETYLKAQEAWIAKARETMQASQSPAVPPLFPGELLPFGNHQEPAMLFNGMVRPILGMGIRGAIWYQGESNRGEGLLYAEKTKALIGGWRQRWGQGDFPFYVVQLAPFNYGGSVTALPEIWEAQTQAAREIPNSGMAVINDIGRLGDIHPPNKQEVGRRLALLALARTYEQKDLVCEGPVFKELKTEGKSMRVVFANTAGKLDTRDGKAPDWFEIIGAGTDYVKADAVIDGDSIVLTAAGVDKPVGVRFAWHQSAEPNLKNGAGLPASAFRAVSPAALQVDDIPVPESKEYRLIYDLNLNNLGAAPAYTVDNRALAGQFSRIAYCLELQKAGEPLKYAYVSLDAFTADAGKIAIPTLASGADFQVKATNLNVFSNVDGITAGTGIAGNLEFWPHNYSAENAAGIAGADAKVYDIGDLKQQPADGYGSMQIHNTAAKQTIIAINNWKNGAGTKADIGIGNSQGQARDWTFTNNAGTYTVKRLRVLVK